MRLLLSLLPNKADTNRNRLIRGTVLQQTDSGLRALLPFFLVFLLTGCSIGPKILQNDYLQYNSSVYESTKREMLLNLVRVRYLETPFFLQIGAITSSHNFSGFVTGTGTLPDSRRPSDAVVRIFGINIGGQVSETPTITYSPLRGEEYVERILTDIRLEEFFSLYDSSWDLALRTFLSVLVEEIGDVKFHSGADESSRMSALRELEDLFDLLTQMQTRGDLSFAILPGKSILLSDRVSKEEVNSAAIIAADKAGYYFQPASDGNYELRKTSGQRYVMILRYRDVQEAEKVESHLGIRRNGEKPEKEGLLRMVELSTLKTLDPTIGNRQDIPVVFIGFRCFAQVMLDLSRGVDLPPSDAQNGSASGSSVDNTLAMAYQEFIKSIIHIKSSKKKPPNAFLSIYHRDNWFYIDDADTDSKVAFDLLDVLYSLKAASKGQAPEPTLTIPVR